MIAIMALAAAAGQAQAPTVGDTVWVVTEVPLAPRQIVRPQGWDLGELAQVLGPPQVELTADSATIRYPVAFWYPGDHLVTVPGPIVVNPEGRSDTLPARRLVVSIRSVLPAGANRDSLAPRDPASPVPQTRPSILPLGVALLGVAGLSGLIGWRLWSRRRPVVVTREPDPPAPDVARLLDAWAAAGETRTALDGWSHLVEVEAKRRGAGLDQAETARLLEALEADGFRPDPPSADADRTIAAAKAWLARNGR
jgi:hypothetical protein